MMLRVGIWGCGGISAMHRSAYKKLEDCGAGVKLVALCDINKENFDREIKINLSKNSCPLEKIDRCYTDIDEMLEKEKLDMVDVCLPSQPHKEAAIKLLRRNINVLLEKPMALSAQDCREIIAAEERSDARLMVARCERFTAGSDYLKAAAESGIVGEPIKLRYINGHTGPLGKGAKHRGVAAKAEEMTDEMRAKTWWHKKSHGGGVFLDIACYGCYFSQWIFGKGDSAIACGENLNTPFGDTDDNFAAVIRYNGKMSVIEGTWTTPRAVIPSGPMLLCTDGVIVCTGGAENAPDVEVYDIYGNKLEVPDVEPGTEFKNMPEMYAHHIKTGAPVYPMLTLSENMKIMAMLDAAMKSAKSGKEDKISEERHCR